MSIVLDASVAASFILPDEQDDISKKVRTIIVLHGALAPRIFWYEMRNILLANERRGRIDAATADRALRYIGALPIALRDVESGDVIGLARTHRLSAYDAAYLALARQERVPLLTYDKSLATAATLEGVPTDA